MTQQYHVVDAVGARDHPGDQGALSADIRAWIKTWNEDPRPYVWTKTADQILDSIARY